ncbi:MAG: hypothetical protein JNL38_07060 [Myxococcales bacterium]|jgi:DNA-binding IclR family transcriptional regulator|nr:hypothetical protein [Myxococcales bacterium]
MHSDLSLLRALARVSRKRLTPQLPALVARSGGDAADVLAALARLENKGLVARRGPDDVRLTFLGLAAALASVPAATSAAPRASDRAPATKARKSSRRAA